MLWGGTHDKTLVMIVEGRGSKGDMNTKGEMTEMTEDKLTWRT